MNVSEFDLFIFAQVYNIYTVTPSYQGNLRTFKMQPEIGKSIRK